MKSKLLLVLLAGMISTTAAFADDYNPYKKGGDCPTTYLYGADGTSGIELEFGGGSSAITTCIAKKKDIRIVLNMSSGVTGGNGVNQVLNNADNMLLNYSNIWGINEGKDLQFKIVAHFQGARFLLNNTKYNALYGTNNPSGAKVADLMTRGVHFYMCQTTMRNQNPKWQKADLIPGVEMVPAGVIALVDFSSTGWTVITP
jgi:intracellular sulfur oxidation DsrE/DsrF family protein